MAAISALMTRGPLVTMGPDTGAGEATRILEHAGVSHLLITEDGDQLLGVCCVCDLEQAATGARVRHVMHDERLWVEANADADEALALMESHQVTCLPVLERGRLSGVITLHALQRLGILGAEEERCSACGSTEHVACVRCGRRRARGLCMECVRKSEPPEPGWELELGGGD